MKFTTKSIPTGLKQAIAIAGLLLTLPGLPLMLGFFCITLGLTIDADREAITVGLVSFMLIAITIGAGGITFWHALHSLRGRVSKPLRLPPSWVLAGIFGLFLALGLSISKGNVAVGLFLSNYGCECTTY